MCVIIYEEKRCIAYECGVLQKHPARNITAPPQYSLRPANLKTWETCPSYISYIRASYIWCLGSVKHDCVEGGGHGDDVRSYHDNLEREGVETREAIFGIQAMANKK